MIEHILLKYESDLQSYCRMLTGTPWDADDLYQETMVKGMKAGTKLLNHPSPKALLFRIASNTWIDECRKRKAHVGLPEGYEVAPSRMEVDSFDIKDSLDHLATELPPFQVVVILLADVFLYSAREIGEMLETSEGAVKAALHRGRKRLSTSEIDTKSRNQLDTVERSSLIQRFLEAIRLQQPERIAHAYLRLTQAGFRAERLLFEGKLHFTIYDPEGNAFTVVAE